MCGRFSLMTVGQVMADRFGIELPNIKPRYNIAPSQESAIITNKAPKKITMARWGLVPGWAKDEKVGYKMINARAETLAEKPAYRNAFKRQRCLIIADGFYEWKKVGNSKVPYRITTNGLFAMAGLWEVWDNKATFTIVTTDANAFMKKIHDRMPLILEKKKEKVWLDTEYPEPLLKPYEGRMQAYQVSSLVNSTSNDTKEVIMPVKTLI